MEYPTLKRPKRKLCYLTNKESSCKKWTEPLTLEEIDKMFDDLDPPSHVNDDLLPPHTLLQTFDVEQNQCERVASPVPQEGPRIEKFLRCQMGRKVDALHPVTSSSPKLDIDLDIPFKAHMPVKTSSPIEVNAVVEELDNAKDQVVFPILFADEDEGKEEAKAELLLIQEPQCNEHGTEENDDSELESPPSKVVFIKPKISSHQNKVEESCKESHPLKEKQIPKKPQTPNLQGENKKRREENADPLVSAARQEPKLAKLSENVHSQPLVESTSVGKDMTSFLKKLRDAGQPKPTCSRKSLTPVKVSTLPAEPEDDFLILEDDNLLWFSIPSKTATSKKQRQGRTSSTDKDSSTDKGQTDSPLETAQKMQESEQSKNKLGSQTLPQKTKKKKGGEKKIKEAEPGNDVDELFTPEDLPAGDLMVAEKPNKRKRLRKVTSKESDKEEEQPKDGASGETYKEKTSQKTEKKAEQPSDMKRPTSLKDGNKNAKAGRAKSLKGGRKVMQGSDVVKQTMKDKAEKGQSQSSEMHADAEDLGSLPDEEIMNSEPQTKKDVADKKQKRNKIPVVSEGTSSEDGQILGKRKRKSPGQWWLDNEDSEETKFTDNQRTLKKSKQPKPEPSVAVQSPVKTKKERASKKRNQTPPAPSSSPNTNKAKGKKTKRNKNPKGDGRPDEVFQGIEAEQFEEKLQQEEVDQDQSGPLVHCQRDHSFNSGDKVFQRVYHNASTKKLSTLAPVSPGGPQDQFIAAESKRRRRKPTGSWWKVNDECEDVESISSQRQGPRPRKERKMVSKRSGSPQLGTLKNGNVAVSSKPQGGAPVCLLEVKPTSAPKTVKRSLATFKDIFTSVTETPAVVTRREPCQKNKRKVATRPAEEDPATVCAIFSERTDGDILSMDAVEPGSPQNSPRNHEMPQNNNCSSENRLKLLRSGPSSMIELKEYEEDDDDNLILRPPSSHAALSVSDLCAPPLKPLVLQLKDKTNLTEWFRSLWSVPADKGPEVTPDQFDWYFYQGRAIGFLVDLNCASFCNGRILLGSYMKKPLWVDHSATTVFNLLTSSVSVTIDGKESCFNPGQSFMVECGHAYNIQNITAQPAVLYFTRMFAESSD
ncbi:neurofilament heavy polypeptide [Clinocottus analis]|uniref:neurofilament heavy polypeptide n=1 Tax=Clinocottus analis TaxID=304258 RepID=UPI0035C16CC7